MRSEAYWRPLVLRDLRGSEAATRIAAVDRILTGYVAVDDEIAAILLDALDDPGEWTFRERDFDGDDDFGRRFVSRTRRVAEEAVRALGQKTRRASSVSAITARITERGPEGSAALYRALGELAPESTDYLLSALEHADVAERRAAQAALGRAVFFSSPPQKLEILRRGIEGLSDPSLGEAWSALLAHKHGLFASHSPKDPMREAVPAHGPDLDTLACWLVSDVLAVREIAMSMLAARAVEAEARALLAARVLEDLPRQRGAPLPRDAFGHRRCTEVELALHILALAYPDALAAMRAEHPAVREALRDHLVHELGKPGAPWFVDLALGRAITDEPTLTEAMRAASAAH